jgi:hypothetical protein
MGSPLAPEPLPLGPFADALCLWYQLHYPEGAEVILVANAPAWFSYGFSVVRPILDEDTQRRVRMIRTPQELCAALEPLV